MTETVDDDLTTDELAVICAMAEGKGAPEELRGLLPALAMRGLVRRIGAPFEGFMLETAGFERAGNALGWEWKNDVRTDVDAFLEGAEQPRNFLAERVEAATPLILKEHAAGRTLGEMARIFMLSRRIIDSIIRADQARSAKETT